MSGNTNGGGFNLSNANAALADNARGSVIEVTRERVLTADAADDDLDSVAWDLRCKSVVGEWTALMDSETNRIDGIGGTMWAALNAVTEWTDKTRSPGVKGDRRDHLKILGAGAIAKRTAMRLALAAV